MQTILGIDLSRTSKFGYGVFRYDRLFIAWSLIYQHTANLSHFYTSIFKWLIYSPKCFRSSPHPRTVDGGHQVKAMQKWGPACVFYWDYGSVGAGLQVKKKWRFQKAVISIYLACRALMKALTALLNWCSGHEIGPG